MPFKHSSVIQDYLKNIYAATEWGGEGITVSGLAAHMGVAASTASENVRKLADLGLVEHEPYKGVLLTPQGECDAVAMVRRHRLLETYLYEHLGFNWGEVHAEAEVLEHAVTDRLLSRIEEKLGYPVRDPHGDPIPDRDGKVNLPAYQRLDRVEPGHVGNIMRISNGDPQLLHYLTDLGLRLDLLIETVSASKSAGMCHLLLGTEKSPLDLSQVAAAAIWVSAEPVGA